MPGHEDDGNDPPRPGDLPSGYDEDDPYEGEDLGRYPDWWRENIELFREYGLRPYRPPRFSDGALTTPLIEELEAELGVRLRLRAVNPQRTGTYDVEVDGERVASVPHSRESDGHTEYDVTSSAFASAVRSAVDPERSIDDESPVDPQGPPADERAPDRS